MKIGVHPEYPDYIVREDGRVFRRTAGGRGRMPGDEVFGRVLKSGYRQFKLINQFGAKGFIRANRLVAEVFHGSPPSRNHHAAHNDGDRLNNASSNLRWASAKENNADQVIHGTRRRGSRVHSAVLTELQVKEVRATYDGSRGQLRRLGERYGISQSALGRVLRNEAYVDPSFTPYDFPRRPLPETRQEILSVYLKSGFQGVRPMLEKLGLTPGYASALARFHGFKSRARGSSGRNGGEL